MRLRWSNKPGPNGSAASFHRYGRTLATVHGSDATGWWWAAGNDSMGVPLAVSRTMLVGTLDQAKRDAESYVRACLGDWK
jgi:hypothetical protein